MGQFQQQFQKPVVLGGSFNPIHLAHVACARQVMERLGFDGVILMPAWRSPFKVGDELASGQHRLRMCELAIEGQADFFVSDLELTRPTASYTFDTVQRLKDQGVANVTWLIGTDHLPRLHQWYRFDELSKQIEFVVMRRAGHEKVDLAHVHPLVAAIAQRVVDVPAMPISSSDIRQRLSLGLDVSMLLHPRVADYIHKHGLYRGRSI